MPEPAGASYTDATRHLAFVHDHMLVTGFLIPVAMAVVLHLTRTYGSRLIGTGALRWVLLTYLPGLTVTLLLMFYKGYHVLLAVRRGTADLAQIDDDLFAGYAAVRHGLYGVSHTMMAIGLCLFAWGAWRSLGRDQSATAL